MSEAREPKRIRDTIIFPASLDPDAVKIIRRLKRHGHEAYLVGGCVRDLLLGAIPKDFDVATSARPKQVRRLFRNSTIIGRRFKLVHVIFRDKIIEVSTFRKPPPIPGAGEDPAGSRAFKADGLLILRDNVYGGPEDDAVRRDFTVNALFYDVDDRAVIDFTGGFEDINRRILRTIGDPNVRFCEDPVRILRAVKFSSRLGLRIEPDQAAAMRAHVDELSKSAPPRIKEEIIRLLACGASRKSLAALFDIGAFPVIFPALASTLDEEATFFRSRLRGREFMSRLAGVMDRLDRGRRIHSDALFLSILFAHHAGVAVTKALGKNDRIHDRAAFIDDILRPIAVPMGVSRRELSRIKQIVNAYPRFERKKWRGRPRPKEFVRREYFPETLVFYRLVAEGLGRDLGTYRLWLSRLEESGTGRGTMTPGREKGRRQRSAGSPRPDRGGRKRGKRRKRRRPAGKSSGTRRERKEPPPSAKVP